MATRPAKRPRISLACSTCREQKTRCDGGKPRCGCCMQRKPESQTPCLYQKKARESKDVQNLLKHITELEAKLAGADRPNSAPGVDELGSHVPNVSPTAYVAGNVRRASDNVRGPSNLTGPSGEHRHGGWSSSSTAQARPWAEPLHGQDVENHPYLDVSNGEGPPTNGETSRTVYEGPTAEAGSTESEIQFHGQTFGRGRESDSIRNEPHGSGSEIPDAVNEPYFHGESSNTALMQEVNDIISPSTRAEQRGHTDHSTGERSIYSVSDSLEVGRKPIEIARSSHSSFRNHTENLELPPRSLADHLLDSYFSCVHILYPFLHKPTFEAAYEKLWAGENQRNGHRSHWNLVRLPDAGLGNSMNAGPESRVFHAGVNAIFALSCQFSDMPIPEAMKVSRTYLDRAMTIFLDIEQFDHPSLSHVQVLLLLCLHLQGTPLRNRLWSLMGMAFRVAQGLGLQVDETSDDGHGKAKNGLEIEMRRRTWYSCVMMDLTISMTLGRPAMTSNGFLIPLPQAIDDRSLSASTSFSTPYLVQPQVGISLTAFFVEAIKLWELTGRIIKALYPDTATRYKVNSDNPTNGEEDSESGFDVLMHLEAVWTGLCANLPPELRWWTGEGHSPYQTGRLLPASELKLKWLETQRHVLHTRFLYVKLLIYRPLFLKVYREKIALPMQVPGLQTPQPHANTNHASSGSPELSSTIGAHFATRFAIECFQAAEELVALVHKHHRTKAATAWWYNIFYAYFTGIILILTRFCPPLAEIVGISRIEHSWALCQEILNNMAIYGNHPKKCLVSLQNLRSRLAVSESDSSRLNSIAPDRRDVEQLNSYAYDQECVSEFMHDKEGRNDVATGLEDSGFEATGDWAGKLPWDADLDSWWTYDMFGEDFIVPTLEQTYY